jgi:O-antigen ligase
MFLDRLSQNITSFRQNIILGIFLFLIVISTFFSGEWSNWMAAIFLILLFPLVFYATLMLRDKPSGAPAAHNIESPFFYLLIFLAAALVTSFFSIMKYDSFHYWTLLVGYAIVFWVASTVIRNFSQVRLISLAIFCTGILASLINLFLFIGDPSARASGALLNANALGSYFLFSVPLGIVLALDEQKKKRKYLLAGGSIIIAISYFLTFSYTSWVSFVLPGAVILVVYRKQIFTLKNIFWVIGLVVLLLVIVVGIRYSNSKDFQQAIQLQKTITVSHFNSSFSQRWNFIRSTVNMFADHVLTGTGLATYQQVYPRYALTVLEQPRYAHNYYLQTAAETGIVGFLGLLGFLIALLVRSWQAIKRNFGDIAKRPYVMGLGLGLLGSIIHSLFDFGWQFPAVFLLFWTAGGLLFGQYQAAKPPDQNQPAHRKVMTKIVASALVLLSIILLLRGVTLFLAQASYDKAVLKANAAEQSEALPAFKRAVSLDPAPDKLKAYAQALFEQGALNKDIRQQNFDQADKIIASIVKWNSGDYFTFNQAGKMFFTRNDYNRAETMYKQAIALDPMFHPEFQYNLAVLYTIQKKYDLVFATLQPILDRYAGIYGTTNPELPNQLALINVLLGQTAGFQGDKTKAAFYYNEAMSRVPDFILAKQALEKLQ